MNLVQKRLITLAVALSLLVVSAKLSDPTRAPSWLGPLAPIAAQVQWVRAEEAIQAGLPGQALQLMESAIELDPSATTGWISLADHLGLYLASAESGASMEARASWLQTALDLTARGEAWAQHPEQLALHRGLLLVSHAELEEPLTWGEGGDSRMNLFSDAVTAFREASALGLADGEQIAQYAEDMIEGMRE